MAFGVHHGESEFLVSRIHNFAFGAYVRMGRRVIPDEAIIKGAANARSLLLST
jgi:hypothetical protein